jgi:hypothetical protein
LACRNDLKRVQLQNRTRKRIFRMILKINIGTTLFGSYKNCDLF